MKYSLFGLVLLLAGTTAFAQSRIIRPAPIDVCKEYGGEYSTILPSPYSNEARRFKIKAAGTVSSETAREADYVEFRLMQDIYSVGADKTATVAFPKETPVFGVVTFRRSRHFPVVRGKLELQLEPLVNWNGERIELAIARHGPIRRSEAETKNDRKQRNDPCKKTDNPYQNCVAGRGNAQVSALVTALAGAGTAAVTSLSKEEETRFIAATAFFNVAKDLANLLNGTDVQVSKDEVFDLVLGTTSVCVLKKPPDGQEQKTPAAPKN